jgi:hypothetical protein
MGCWLTVLKYSIKHHKLQSPHMPGHNQATASIHEYLHKPEAFVMINHKTIDQISLDSDLANNEHLAEDTVAVIVYHIGGNVTKLRALMDSFLENTINGTNYDVGGSVA